MDKSTDLPLPRHVGNPNYPNCSICAQSELQNNYFSFVLEDYWSFEGNSDDWKSLNPLAGEPRLEALGFIIQNKIFMGLGVGYRDDYRGSPSYEDEYIHNDLYVFDITQANNTEWHQMEAFPGKGKSKVAFSNSNTGYVLTFDKENQESYFWQFDPSEEDLGTWSQLDFSAEITGIPSVAFSAGNAGYVYFHLNQGVSNFWMYIPELD